MTERDSCCSLAACAHGRVMQLRDASDFKLPSYNWHCQCSGSANGSASAVVSVPRRVTLRNMIMVLGSTLLLLSWYLTVPEPGYPKCRSPYRYSVRRATSGAARRHRRDTLASGGRHASCSDGAATSTPPSPSPASRWPSPRCKGAYTELELVELRAPLPVHLVCMHSLGACAWQGGKPRVTAINLNEHLSSDLNHDTNSLTRRAEI